MEFLIKCIVSPCDLNILTERWSKTPESEFADLMRKLIQSPYVYFAVPVKSNEDRPVEHFSITFLQRTSRIFYYDKDHLTDLSFESFGRALIFNQNDDLLNESLINEKGLLFVSIKSESEKMFVNTMKGLFLQTTNNKTALHPVFNTIIHLPILNFIYQDQFFIDPIKELDTTKKIKLLIENFININKKYINKRGFNVSFITRQTKPTKYDLSSVFEKVTSDLLSKFNIRVTFKNLPSMENVHDRVLISEYFSMEAGMSFTDKINIKLYGILNFPENYLTEMKKLKFNASNSEVFNSMGIFTHPIVFNKSTLSK